MKIPWQVPATDRELQKLVTEWQKRLRLQDWHIKGRFPQNKADRKRLGEGGFGVTTGVSSLKEARILINRPEHISKQALGCRDIEVTLVHELLHLHSNAFDHFFSTKEANRPTENYALEAMIELVAIALVEAKRGVPREKW